MEKEYLIKKWLDNDLNNDELIAFKSLHDYEELITISNHAKTLEVPSFNSEDELKHLKNTINTKKNNPSKNWLNPLLKIAALFVLCFGIFQFTNTSESSFATKIAQKDKITLPDHSIVNLNALSTLTFNEEEWDTNRNVTLKGEAFFDVAKGATFNVNTTQGMITVYGTEFNVKTRDDYFEVICYEGLVGVTYNNKEIKLKPGDSFLVLKDKIISQNKNSSNRPFWLDNESVFKSIPYKEVIAEFERQYNVTIITEGINTDLLFTGGFSHKNIKTSLVGITSPLKLTCIIEGSTITLKRD